MLSWKEGKSLRARKEPSEAKGSEGASGFQVLWGSFEVSLRAGGTNISWDNKVVPPRSAEGRNKKSLTGLHGDGWTRSEGNQASWRYRMSDFRSFRRG